MQFITLLIASAAAVSASALPKKTPIATGQGFGVITIRSGSEIQNSGVQAANSGLLIHAKSQNASCDADTNFATFYINKEQELHLVESTSSARPQTIYVDRSEKGQGLIGYTTGAQPVPGAGEAKGWTVDNNELKFKGTGIQACSGGVDGSWSLWLDGPHKAGNNESCISVISSAIKSDKPIGCWYTE
ncbi:hypothetical protein P171DRAFT_521463 [Karstenula rhodostoma CBS 690.94]|uniref:Cell wall protein PhiA n=1 Tax=Karstenula rhodostoma CBS 690.94 TaxID=1392251 RepID=A0A9P4UC80_9PLEO|nr:hypothetical protein P171DRAFT_521463 [Karstenula rhodostoma CBS 690.94]